MSKQQTFKWSSVRPVKVFEIEPDRYPWWFGKPQPRTVFQRMNALKGLHPTGNELHENTSLKCGVCVYRNKSMKGRCTWLPKQVHGDGLRVLAKWPACENYIPLEPEDD